MQSATKPMREPESIAAGVTTEAQQEDLVRIVRELRLELRALQAERVSAMAEIRMLTLAKEDALRRQQRAERMLDSAKAAQSEWTAERAAQARSYSHLQEQIAAKEAELNALHNTLDAQRNVNAQLLNSLSWKITAPLRAVMRSVRALSQR